MNAIAPSAPDEIDALADRIAETAAMLDAATHRLLTDLRRFDEQEGWARQGAVSCAHWLGWRCGIALGAAREKLRVAHALAQLPLIDAALRDGQLSFSKARAMTRIATPDNEANLLELARQATAAQLEKICRLYGQTQPRDPAAEEERRYLRVRDTDDGMVRIEIQLRPDEAARVLKACDVSAETRMDGLVAMAEATLRGDHPDRPPVDVMVHVDAATLTGRDEQVGIPADTARRLLCDAGIVPVLAGEDAHGTPLDVGRKTRSVPTALRRALVARDVGCRFPGCAHTRYVDAHHVRHWVDGGETTLANTVLLCTRHHTLVHEGGFRVTTDGDGLRFFDRRGIELPSAGTPPAVRITLPRVLAPSPVGDGNPVDYAAAVGCLM
ncbi:MAG TPA: DUF222 domain-containing protein [Haliangiales bacterium]|nr:DUF222 domain-containing protein [Haliangiales bacterium]